MKASGGTEAAKRRAAEHAADRAADGMVVGLGTGSTAAYAIDAIGRAVDAGLDVRGVATSYQALETGRRAGVPMVPLAAVERVDLAIDGADQVAGGDLLKGGGGAHAREKVVAAAAGRLAVVVDDSKLADRLHRPVPVEVLPGARRVVAEALRDLGGDPVLREAGRKDGPVVTEHGNLILDSDFGPIEDPAALAVELSGLAGAVDHGLFVGLADEIHVGREASVDVLNPRRS